jgi:hypothetical protein
MIEFDYMMFIILLVTIDVTLTYANIRLYRKYHPQDKKWFTLERNPLGTFIFQHAGLEKGIIILWIFASSFISLLFILTNADIFGFVFVFGMYFTIIYIHFLMMLSMYRYRKDFRRKF